MNPFKSIYSAQVLGILSVALFFSLPSFAEKSFENQPNPYPGVLLAQAGDDAYDPFLDYSEFEEASEEEADINFFKNGRFFTIGFMGGYRGMTQGMTDVYRDAFQYGLFISYFFDLRFALQFSFSTGSHDIGFTSPGGTVVSGTSKVTAVGINLKYYLNTQNVTKGLAQLNPYIIGGFSQVSRTSTVEGQEAFAKDGTTAFDIGLGLEVPVMRNQMFLGIQGVYQVVNFEDENTEIVIDGTDETGLFPNGDYINGMVVLGINF